MHSLSVQPQYGRRQVLYKMWDAERYPFMRTTKSTFLTYMTLAREPKTQIAGITLLGDMQEMTRKHAPGNWTEVKMYASFMRVGDLPPDNTFSDAFSISWAWGTCTSVKVFLTSSEAHQS